ncbi:DUF2127 domain-containing protein [Psychrobacter sanguinis]|uniref:DUF2127 domain-containing protein n=1 Tax=Psychrobacter sanguinis TaxID=861445 RepID=UPI001918AB8F|nr:DUF2127 domain-containing protein [Psychrobacter sanguinis]MCC3345138.1 DUF2127 domain-containing protein [Psychrobacter sanguinis]
MTEPYQISGSIKAVTLYEVIKGFGAVITALALWAWHKEVPLLIQSANSAWIKHFGELFSVQVGALTRSALQASQNWPLFTLLILGYAALRFLEAYGLSKDKTWAYWYSVLGYGIFVPLELYYLIVRPFDWIKLGVLILNIIVIIVVYRQMRRKGLL